MPSKLSKDKYLSLIQSCAENCTAPYCFFKIFLESQHPDERIICQFKCVEILKWEIGEIEKRDIGFNEAGMRWVTDGWAKAFAQVYEPGIPPRDIYYRTKILVQNSNNTHTNVSSQSSKTTTSEIK